MPFDDGQDHRKPLSFLRWTHGMLNRLVALTDAALILAAGVAAMLLPLSQLSGTLTPLQCGVLVLTEIACFHQVMTSLGAYRVERYSEAGVTALHLLIALLPAWAASTIILAAFMPHALVPSSRLIAWHGVELMLLMLGRWVQAWLIAIADRRRLLRRRVVIVGANATAERVLRDLRGATDHGYEILGVFQDPSDGEAAERLGGFRVAGDLEALNAFALTHTIDVVILALPWSRGPEIFRLMEAVNWIAADVVIPFDEDMAAPSFAAIVPMGGGTTLQVMSRPFKGTQGLLKVIEDYAVASVALLAVSPLMMAAAIAIRLEDGGPILFRQWRPGFGRAPFAILKFRTMKVNAHDDATIGTTGRDDPRITRVGAVLRRLSIDELPQLLNVLKGEMSVVGPRPYVADMLVGNERFSDLVAQYAERHRIKPGLTGYAQAYGMRSYALRSPDNARRSIEMDLHYMTHWSIWLDIRIMLRTMVSGLAGRHVF